MGGLSVALLRRELNPLMENLVSKGFLGRTMSIGAISAIVLLFTLAWWLLLGVTFSWLPDGVRHLLAVSLLTSLLFAAGAFPSSSLSRWMAKLATLIFLIFCSFEFYVVFVVVSVVVAVVVATFGLTAVRREESIATVGGSVLRDALSLTVVAAIASSISKFTI